MRLSRVVKIVALTVVAGALAACGGSDEGDEAAGTTTTTPPPTAAPPPPPQAAPPRKDETRPAKTTPTQPQTSKKTIKIVVAKGRVAGGVKTTKVKKGTSVVLVVAADVSDEVHLHGYDLKRNVSPDAPATIVFRARLTGRFDIELEDRSLRIGELEVRP